MGRPRVPASLNVFNGNPGKRKPRKPLNVVGIPVCPNWLDEYAKAVWKRKSKELIALGILKSVDELQFAAYCQACAEFKAATDHIKIHGRVIEVPIQTRQGDVIGHDQKSNPSVNHQRSAWAAMTKLASEFAMTAAARARLETNEDDAPDLEELLKSG